MNALIAISILTTLLFQLTVQTVASGSEENTETCRFSTPEGECLLDDMAADAYYRTSQRTVDIGKFGKAQEVGGEYWRETMDVIHTTKEYMVNVFKNETMRQVRKDCQCRHHLCSFWAAIGECDNNPDYMLLHCPPSCQSCHHLMFEHRCPFDKNAPSIWGKGDLNKMFQRITTDPAIIEQFQPTIYSRDPWIVTLENIATEEECKVMIEAGQKRGYEKSKDVGSRNFDGTYGSTESKDRTSSNTWCVDECFQNEHHQHVLHVVENITQIPINNSEYWQLLQYTEGQFYRRHHDYVPHHNERHPGPRILTVFVYLNDVENGGGTRFTDLNITVEPRRGRALLWPSVLDENPFLRERRTHHEALEVLKGVKYGANAWVHARDFKTSFAAGCS